MSKEKASKAPAAGHPKALSGWLRAPRRRLVHYFERPREDETKWYSLCGVYKPGDLYGEVRDAPKCIRCYRLALRLTHSATCGGQPAGSGCICGVGFVSVNTAGGPQKDPQP